MAYANIHHGSNTATAFGQLAAMTGRLWHAYRGWRARREMLRMLYSLDRGTLKDIGVSPHEIESLVYGQNGDRVRSYDENWWQRG